jgi:hypothetical protein
MESKILQQQISSPEIKRTLWLKDGSFEILQLGKKKNIEKEWRNATGFRQHYQMD